MAYHEHIASLVINLTLTVLVTKIMHPKVRGEEGIVPSLLFPYQCYEVTDCIVHTFLYLRAIAFHVFSKRSLVNL